MSIKNIFTFDALIIKCCFKLPSARIFTRYILIASVSCFVIFPLNERTTNAKQVQMMTGLNPGKFSSDGRMLLESMIYEVGVIAVLNIVLSCVGTIWCSGMSFTPWDLMDNLEKNFKVAFISEVISFSRCCGTQQPSVHL